MADVFKHLAEADDPEQYIEETAPWVYLANKPYLDYLFGSEEEAFRITRQWMHRDTSEVSIKNIHLLFRDGVNLGGIVNLEGRNLARARKADLMAILKDVDPSRRESVLKRLKSAGHLFVYPRHDEYYLAKMGVMPAAQGKGVGKLIFGLGIEAGAARGYRKFRGDVHVDNIAALKVYQSFGFEIVARNESEEAGLAYVSVYMER